MTNPKEVAKMINDSEYDTIIQENEFLSQEKTKGSMFN